VIKHLREAVIVAHFPSGMKIAIGLITTKGRSTSMTKMKTEMAD